MAKQMSRGYLECLLLTVLWQWRMEDDTNNKRKVRRVRVQSC